MNTVSTAGFISVRLNAHSMHLTVFASQPFILFSVINFHCQERVYTENMYFLLVIKIIIYSILRTTQTPLTFSNTLAANARQKLQSARTLSSRALEMQRGREADSCGC